MLAPAGLRLRPGGLRLPRHGPGDHRRRLLRPGHRQRPVGLRALAHRDRPQHQGEIKKDFGFEPNFEKAKHYLEENDGAGNTFKATAKPVLIGTAVVGATTMIFSIIMVLTDKLTDTSIAKLSILHAPFLLGLIAGGAIIYWFTGASTQAVSTGAYRAVEFIKANIKLDGRREGLRRGLQEGRRDLHAVRAEGHVQHLPRGLLQHARLRVLRPFFFIGYLISIALFGLYQALFMANAGGAWDNAKKLVEVELKAKGTPLHAACVVGDTVGDPFKDTSSVAMNPVIKFTTLFRPARRRAGLPVDEKKKVDAKGAPAAVPAAH
jgi:K(+)-stimulated pyrophosphate-energized sodium pump